MLFYTYVTYTYVQNNWKIYSFRGKQGKWTEQDRQVIVLDNDEPKSKKRKIDETESDDNISDDESDNASDNEGRRLRL